MTYSLSHIIPSIIESECHLQSSHAPKALISAMLNDMNSRFDCSRNPASMNFNPIPAAACLLDPTMAPILLTADLKTLLAAAKSYIITQVKQDLFTATTPDTAAGSSSADDNNGASLQPDGGSNNLTALRRQFPHLAMKLSLSYSQNNPNQGSAISSVVAAVNKYIAGMKAGLTEANAFEFWENKCSKSYVQLSQLPLNLMAPALQAFVARLFSVCSMLTDGRRNRMSISHLKCVCGLKLI